MPGVWNLIINEIATNVDAFNMIPYEQQSNIEGHLNKLILHYQLNDPTVKTNFGLIKTGTTLGVTIPKKPHAILHTADVGTLDVVPFSYINALHLVHKLDKIISDGKTEFDETSKYVKTRNFTTELNIAQNKILESLHRSIGK